MTSNEPSSQLLLLLGLFFSGCIVDRIFALLYEVSKALVSSVAVLCIGVAGPHTVG